MRRPPFPLARILPTAAERRHAAVFRPAPKKLGTPNRTEPKEIPC